MKLAPWNRHPVPPSERDRGASALLIALTMILLMGMTALAVDGGLSFNERRQAQSGADFGALSAALLSSFPGSLPNECSGLSDTLEQAACKGAVEAINTTEGNLPGRDLNWLTCSDPITDPTSVFDSGNGGFTPEVRLNGDGKLDPLGTLQPVDCIHYSSNTHRARVRVPTIDLDTTFAKVIGFDTIQVSAFAEVAGTLPLETKVLPFAIPGDFSFPYDCLKTGPNPDWGVCKDLPSVGNFGYADIPVYGVDELGTTAQADNCNPNNQSLVSNIVRGIDHWIEPHPTGTVSPGNKALRDDSGNDTADRTYVCPVWPGNANEIGLQTGVVSGAFETGMVWGYGSAERGRIWDESGVRVRNSGAGNPETFVNNEPLWDYLNSDGQAFCGSVTNTQEMVTCLDDWDDDGVIFREGAAGIRFADRFAYAPLLYDVFGAQSWYLIEDLLPIYIDNTYWGCSSGGGGGSAGRCDVIHAPGETSLPSCDPVPEESPPGSEPIDTTCGVSGNANENLAGVTTYILKDGMLPDDAKLPFTSTGPLIDISLTR